jgi:DNA-binding Lrp family transcriptional regulator
MLHDHLRDSLDFTVLFHLQENSCQSTPCLAKKLRVARSTIHERIIKLEHKQGILEYTPTLKQESHEVQALLFTQVESGCTGR